MPQKTPSKNHYHHGDLRQSALDIGLKMLENNESVDLSLRNIARQAKVSATAMYRHFPSKDALLDALAKEGMDRLGHIQSQVAKEAGGGLHGLGAMGIAYVEFAVEHPALFRLIYQQATTIDPLEGDISQVDMPIRGLRENIRDIMPKDWPETYRTTAALHTWSLVHGLAMLILDKQIEYNPKTIEQVVLATQIMSSPPNDPE